MARKSMKSIFSDEPDPLDGYASAKLPYPLQVDILRRVHRKADGVVREGQKIVVTMPNKAVYALWIVPDPTPVLTVDQVLQWGVKS